MTNELFEYKNLAHTVYFGTGKRHKIPELLNSYSSTFAIGTSRLDPLFSEINQQLKENTLIRFAEVIQHVPASLVKKAMRAFEQAGCDSLLAIGGGSAIGLAKAIALETGSPIIAVPTTFSGSEMTNIYGISADGGKKTGRDDRVMPSHIIYDPELTAGLPPKLAATSAMNAMAHLMEAVYATNNNPVTYNNSLLGIKQLLKGMKLLAAAGSLTPEANEHILFGAYLAGKCLGEVSMALHHKSAHVLGGSFGMEHSQVHTVMQAYVLAYQWPSLSEQIKKDFQQAMGHSYPPAALQQIAQAMGASTTLEAIGFKEADIPEAARIMAANPYPNPTPLTAEGLEAMLRNAFVGKID